MTDSGQTEDALGALTLRHLESVVRIDSASDERSSSIPSTEGQRVLADVLRTFFEKLGCDVVIDRFGTIIAHRPGPGAGAERAPLALLVHLDTARGTRAVEHLNVARAWAGDAIPYPANAALQVNVDNYPSLAQFVGHDVVFGPGDAPFGLDDKLGLAHLMTLATMLALDGAAHRPLYFVARPDEEIGRHAALEDLATWLADRGVTEGYTIDGLDAFEVNIENFEASHARVMFDARPTSTIPSGYVRVALGGVNTHGATAHAEGHRGAIRFASEVCALLRARDVDAEPVDFANDEERDCDGVLILAVIGDQRAAIEEVVAHVVAPHIPRGASYTVETTDDAPHVDGAVADVLAWISEFASSNPGYALWAEDSQGREGYSYPYRVQRTESGPALDVRLRDFDRDALDARQAHVRRHAAHRPCEVVQQYVNMGPALAAHPQLVTLAMSAGAAVGVSSEIKPIRGGTGVDPLLEAGVFVANLGTGYFAPESEKELTSLQTMVGHARWLHALVCLPA